MGLPRLLAFLDADIAIERRDIECRTACAETYAGGLCDAVDTGAIAIRLFDLRWQSERRKVELRCDRAMNDIERSIQASTDRHGERDIPVDRLDRAIPAGGGGKGDIDRTVDT